MSSGSRLQDRSPGIWPGLVTHNVRASAGTSTSPSNPMKTVRAFAAFATSGRSSPTWTSPTISPSAMTSTRSVSSAQPEIRSTLSSWSKTSSRSSSSASCRGGSSETNGRITTASSLYPSTPSLAGSRRTIASIRTIAAAAYTKLRFHSLRFCAGLFGGRSRPRSHVADRPARTLAWLWSAARTSTSLATDCPARLATRPLTGAEDNREGPKRAKAHQPHHPHGQRIQQRRRVAPHLRARLLASRR